MLALMSLESDCEALKALLTALEQEAPPSAAQIVAMVDKVIAISVSRAQDVLSYSEGGGSVSRSRSDLLEIRKLYQQIAETQAAGGGAGFVSQQAEFCR